MTRKISNIELATEIEECKDIVSFLGEAITHMLEGSSAYTQESGVSSGASASFRLLHKKLERLLERI